jgi:hypothetical protein
MSGSWEQKPTKEPREAETSTADNQPAGESIAEKAVSEKPFTPESIEADALSLEQDEAVPPEEKVERYEKMESEIDAYLEKLKAGDSEEQERVYATLARLGIPRSDDKKSTHTSEVYRKESTRLEELKRGVSEKRRAFEAQKALNSKDGTEVSSAEFMQPSPPSETEAFERQEGIRKGAGEMIEALSQFSNEIDRRRKNGIDPFYTEQSYSMMRAGIGRLQEIAESKGELRGDDFADALSVVHEGLKKMEVRRGGPIRDNVTSLGTLSSATRALYESASKTSKWLRPGDENASRTLRSLLTEADRVGSFAARKRTALRNLMR